MTTNEPIWQFRGQPFEDPADWLGFVYVIENVPDRKYYIGKKLFVARRTRMVKGRRRHFTVASDWQTYWGSNSAVWADRDRLGASSFTRTMLALVQSRGQLSYIEAELQFRCRVLQNAAFYNGIINCRINSKHCRGRTDLDHEYIGELANAYQQADPAGLGRTENPNRGL